MAGRNLVVAFLFVTLRDGVANTRCCQGNISAAERAELRVRPHHSLPWQRLLPSNQRKCASASFDVRRCYWTV